MINYDFTFRIEKMCSDLDELKSLVNELHASLYAQDSLWDNADMIRYFKISERTLANWRYYGLISYIKVNGKIYYSKEDRESFLRNHRIDCTDVSYEEGGYSHG